MGPEKEAPPGGTGGGFKADFDGYGNRFDDSAPSPNPQPRERISDPGAEFFGSAAATTEADLDELAAGGIQDRGFLRYVPGARAAVAEDVEPVGDFWFQFSPHGKRMVLIADGWLWWPNGHDKPPAWEQVTEIVAFDLAQPDRWFVRCGHEPVLGFHNLELAKFSTRPTPIRLHATPLEFAAAGGEGVCILDWSIPLGAWFDNTVPTGPRHVIDHFRKVLEEQSRPRLHLEVVA